MDWPANLMNTQEQLLKLYERWGDLTTDEGVAIGAADWAKVAQYQAEKWMIRNQIHASSSQLEAEIQAGLVDPNAIHKQIHYRVDELIGMEMENERALAEQRQLAEREQWELQRSSQNLRRLHRAYAPALGPAWDTYS